MRVINWVLIWGFSRSFHSRGTQIRAHGSNKTYILSNIYFEIICLLIVERKMRMSGFGILIKNNSDMKFFFGFLKKWFTILFDQISFYFERGRIFVFFEGIQSRQNYYVAKIESIKFWKSKDLGKFSGIKASFFVCYC